MGTTMKHFDKIHNHIKKAPQARRFCLKKWVKKAQLLYFELSDVAEQAIVGSMVFACMVLGVGFLMNVKFPSSTNLIFSIMGGIAALYALTVGFLIANKFTLDFLAFKNVTIIAAQPNTVAKYKSDTMVRAQQLNVGAEIFEDLKSLAADPDVPYGWWIRLNELFDDVGQIQQIEQSARSQNEEQFRLCQMLENMSYNNETVVMQSDQSKTEPVKENILQKNIQL